MYSKYMGSHNAVSADSHLWLSEKDCYMLYCVPHETRIEAQLIHCPSINSPPWQGREFLRISMAVGRRSLDTQPVRDCHFAGKVSSARTEKPISRG